MGNAKRHAAKPIVELRRWCERTGTTQANLAALLKISEAQMSRLISGTRRMTLDDAVTLSRETRIPVEKLLKDDSASRFVKFLVEQQESTGRKVNNAATF